MIGVTIKYFAITAASFYIFVRILNIGTSRKQRIIIIGLSLLFAVEAALLREYITHATYLILLVSTVVPQLGIFRRNINTTIKASVIALAASAVLSIFTMFLSSVITVPLFAAFAVTDDILTNIIGYASFAVLQLIAMTLPFKFRRFKNGMPFINDERLGGIGMVIGIIALSAISLITRDATPQLQYVIPIFMLPFCGMFMVIWWRGRLTQKYLAEIKKREEEALKAEIAEKEKEISELAAQNAELSKIIHKDNKLIPAMEMAVTELAAADANAEQILGQLKEMSSERVGVLADYEHKSARLPKTDIQVIDALMLFMLSKAEKKSVLLEVEVNGNFENMPQDNDFMADTLTLLADLTENAIISASCADEKQVLVKLTCTDCFAADISDSGDGFGTDIIAGMGKRRITSHKNDGGSGIGLMTTCELVKKHLAELVIDEKSADRYGKTVRLTFNGKNRIGVRTDRAEIIQAAKSNYNIRLDV